MNRTLAESIRAILFLALALLSACASRGRETGVEITVGSTVRDIPTWTPEIPTQTATPLTTAIPLGLTAPKASSPIQASPTSSTQVQVSAIGGNVFVRRGPSVDYNPIGVLIAGDTALAVGRDRVSRWLNIEISNGEGATGWVSILTEFTNVSGEVDRLPVVPIEPAIPATIRNCTGHTMWILPAQIQLLPQGNEPYNEDRLPPGSYRVYDLDVAANTILLEVDLREGLSVDITRDGADDRSKCP